MREILAALLVAGCGSASPTADATSEPDGSLVVDARRGDAGTALGSYTIAWIPLTFGAESPIDASERLDIGADFARFIDEDGGCVVCGAELEAVADGACIRVSPAQIGSKHVDGGELCASENDVSGSLVLSGYPGPPQPVTWMIRGPRR